MKIACKKREYTSISTVSDTLFGDVVLGICNASKRKVAIKRSSKTKLNQLREKVYMFEDPLGEIHALCHIASCSANALPARSWSSQRLELVRERARSVGSSLSLSPQKRALRVFATDLDTTENEALAPQNFVSRPVAPENEPPSASDVGVSGDNTTTTTTSTTSTSTSSNSTNLKRRLVGSDRSKPGTEISGVKRQKHFIDVTVIPRSASGGSVIDNRKPSRIPKRSASEGDVETAIQREIASCKVVDALSAPATEQRAAHGPSSENIIRMLDWVEDARAVTLVLQYCGGGNLLQYVQAEKQPGAGIDQDMARQLFRQMAKGLSFVHSCDMAHLDVSLENFLLHVPSSPPDKDTLGSGGSVSDDEIIAGDRDSGAVASTDDVPHTPSAHSSHSGRNPITPTSQAAADAGEDGLTVATASPSISSWVVKLCDFGQATSESKRMDARDWRGSMPGKNFYCAPELHTISQKAKQLLEHGGATMEAAEQSPQLQYKFALSDAQKADVFSLGICLLILLTGCPPWDKASTRDRSFVFFQKHGLLPLLRHRHQHSLVQHGNVLTLLQGMMGPAPQRWRLADVLKHSYCSAP